MATDISVEKLTDQITRCIGADAVAIEQEVKQEVSTAIAVDNCIEELSDLITRCIGTDVVTVEQEVSTAIAVDNCIEELSDLITRCIGTDVVTVEQEVSTAVAEALEEGYLLPTSNIWSDDGRTAQLAFDGIATGKFNGQELLVLVEVKHSVTPTHITCEEKTKPGLLEKMEEFREILARVDQVQTAASKVHKVAAQYALLRKYKECRVVGAVGGPNFEESVQEFAERKGLITVATSGTQYTVAYPNNL